MTPLSRHHALEVVSSPGGADFRSTDRWRKREPILTVPAVVRGVPNRLTWSRTGKERRRADLLYTCEIGVNGRVVCEKLKADAYRCPVPARGLERRLSPSPFSVSVQIRRGVNPQTSARIAGRGCAPHGCATPSPKLRGTVFHLERLSVARTLLNFRRRSSASFALAPSHVANSQSSTASRASLSAFFSSTSSCSDS